VNEDSFWRSRRRVLKALGVAGLVSAGALKYLSSWTSAGYSSPIGGTGDLPFAGEFDACIIGSGPAGAILGLDLVQAGLRVLILESGTDPRASPDPRIGQIHKSTNAGPIAYPGDTTRYCALGGTSNIWTGRCDRLHPSDFSDSAYLPAGARWPISYADLRAYYSRAERTLHVGGGPLSAYHPPRDGALPLPGKLVIAHLKDVMKRANVVVDDSPTSYSPTGDGPVRVARDLLPRFASHPGAAVVAGATVTRLIPDENGRIVSAEARNLDGQASLVRARTFIIAAGAIESPRLLLLSQTERFPDGPGNRYGHVGRYFNEHPNIVFRGMIPHDLGTLSPQYELGRSHQYYEEFKRRGLGGVLMVFSQSWAFPDDRATWGLNAIEANARRLISRVAKAELQIGATIEMEPVADNRIGLSTHTRDLFGNPVPEIHLRFSERDQRTMAETRRLIRELYARLGATDVQELAPAWSHHHIGTCRMGSNPATSVTDENLRVHGCPNLYVLGSANFVTGGASHPTLAIAAFAHRLAGHLRDRMNGGAFPGARKATRI
jgi:choline dehydrogenase-like flavoprotein